MSTGCRSACSRCAPHVLALLGRTHDPANVERAVDGRAPRRHRSHQPRPHLRHAGRERRRLGGHARRRARARARARQRVRADRRGRHAAREGGRGGRAPGARRRRPGAQVRARRRPARGRRAPVVRDLQLGPAGRRVPPQPPLLGPGRLRRGRVRRPRAPLGAPLVERAHARSLHRRGRRRGAHGGGRRGPRRGDASRRMGHAGDPHECGDQARRLPGRFSGDVANIGRSRRCRARGCTTPAVSS